MARPKEKTSTAFQQKCQAAADKLRKFQATILQTDISRLLTEAIHSDIQIQTDGAILDCHSCIIRARSEDLYKWLTKHGSTAADVFRINLRQFPENFQRKTLQCIRALYTEDEIQPYLRELQDCLDPPISHSQQDQCPPDNSDDNNARTSSCTSEHYVDSTASGSLGLEPRELYTDNDQNNVDTLQQQAEADNIPPANVANDSSHDQTINGCHNGMSRETLHSISENITNFSLDRVKNEAFSAERSNRNQNADAEDSELQKIAERVVNKVVREARHVVNRDDDQVAVVRNASNHCDKESGNQTGVRLENQSDIKQVDQTDMKLNGNQSNCNSINNGASNGAMSTKSNCDSRESISNCNNGKQGNPYQATILHNGLESCSKEFDQIKHTSVTSPVNDVTTTDQTYIGASNLMTEHQMTNIEVMGVNRLEKVEDGTKDTMSGGHTATKSTNRACLFKMTKSHPDTKSLSALLDKVYGYNMKVEPFGQLSDDLLRLLLTQDSCDSVIQVNSDSFRAHRCILSARSTYFEAMLGGSWRELDDDCILLEGVEASTLKQALLYLYGGIIEIDSSCGLGGLIQLADMYSMDGLKEVVAFNLNMEYCHFFHRPCSVCIAGVPEALALSMMYNLDALKDKCVKWINKNFSKVWPTKNFALLPNEVLQFCITNAVKDLAIDNVVDTLIDCRQLNEKMAKLKWTEPIFDMITRLMDASIEFASQNFINLISGNMLRKIDQQGTAFNKQPIEDIFSMIITTLTPEMLCQAYVAISKWIQAMKAREEEKEMDPLFSEEFEELITMLFKKSKEQLCLYIHQAANTAEWDLLTKDMQTDIMKDASYVCIETNRGKMSRPKLTSMQKNITGTSGMSLKEYFDCHFGHTNFPACTSTATKYRASKATSSTQHKSTATSRTKISGPRELTSTRTITSEPSIKKKATTAALSKKGVGLNNPKVKTVPKVKESSVKNGNKGKVVDNCAAGKVHAAVVNQVVKRKDCAGNKCDQMISSGEEFCESLPVDDQQDEVNRLENIPNIENLQLVDFPSPICFTGNNLVPILDVIFNDEC